MAGLDRSQGRRQLGRTESYLQSDAFNKGTASRTPPSLIWRTKSGFHPETTTQGRRMSASQQHLQGGKRRPKGAIVAGTDTSRAGLSSEVAAHQTAQPGTRACQTPAAPCRRRRSAVNHLHCSTNLVAPPQATSATRPPTRRSKPAPADASRPPWPVQPRSGPRPRSGPHAQAPAAGRTSARPDTASSCRCSSLAGPRARRLELRHTARPAERHRPRKGLRWDAPRLALRLRRPGAATTAGVGGGSGKGGHWIWGF
jgi:hypothetical protein